MEEKKFIVRTEDMYVTMPVGQLNPTQPKDLRTYFIGQALAGLCVRAIPGSHNAESCMAKELPKAAVAIADAIIELLNDDTK